MRRVCSAILIIVLGLALATPARANTLDDDARNIIIGVVAVTAAIAVLVTVLIIRHNSPKSTITGCVQSGTNGMSLTDEKNGLNYTLAGSTLSLIHI